MCRHLGNRRGGKFNSLCSMLITDRKLNTQQRTANKKKQKNQLSSINACWFATQKPKLEALETVRWPEYCVLTGQRLLSVLSGKIFEWEFVSGYYLPPNIKKASNEYFVISWQARLKMVGHKHVYLCFFIRKAKFYQRRFHSQNF